MNAIETIREESGGIVTAVIYMCVDRSTPKGDTIIATRLDEMHNFAQQNNLIMVDWYIDHGDGKEYSRLLADISYNAFDVVIVCGDRLNCPQDNVKVIDIYTDNK